MRRILATAALALSFGALAAPALYSGHGTSTATAAGWCCKT
jgi:hypothetical protein